MADYSPTRIPDSVKERFWAKVDVRGLDECWEWQGCRDPKGYGRIGFFIDRKHKVYVTSRFSLMLKAGFIPPPNIVTRHKCDNPPCVNPNHLEWGTIKDNARDASDRGRFHYLRKTVCVRGHDISDNSAVYVHNTGKRAGKRGLCKKCSSEYRKQRLKDAKERALISG